MLKRCVISISHFSSLTNLISILPFSEVVFLLIWLSDSSKTCPAEIQALKNEWAEKWSLFISVLVLLMLNFTTKNLKLPILEWNFDLSFWRDFHVLLVHYCWLNMVALNKNLLDKIFAENIFQIILSSKISACLKNGENYLFCTFCLNQIKDIN